MCFGFLFIILFNKSLWFWHARIFYHKLFVYICVFLEITSRTFLLPRARFRDLQSRGYYMYYFISDETQSCRQVICKNLPSSLNYFLSWIWEIFWQASFSASPFFFLSLCSQDSRIKQRQQNQTTVSAQSSEFSFRITADAVDNAELVCSGSSGDCLDTSGPVAVSWPGLCLHFFTMSDSCSNNTLQPTQPACPC